MDTAMLVEPEKQRKRLISGLLEEAGLRVQSFDTAEEAVDQVERVAPDLMILEMKMPTRSGLEVLEQLRGYGMPVILLTANETVALKHDLYSVGDVVPGPIANKDLKTRIRGILKRRSRISRAQPRRWASHPVASHVLPELHDPVTGRLDAGRIAAFLGTPLTAFAKFSGMSVAGLHKSPASASLQQGLIPIARSLTILSQLLGSKENTRAWMNSPHPDLGGRTPIGVVLEGKGRAVSDMLEAALAGQPS
jgi:CheY-like chemotaxis protein